VKRNWLTKIAVATAVAAMAFGGVACEVDEDALDPGLENDLMDEDF
jgi:hypothetical protein